MADPGAARVARFDGGVDGAVVLQDRGPKGRGLEVVLHALPHLAAPAVPEPLHDRAKGAVVRGRRDGQMEGAIGLVGALVVVLTLLHLVHRLEDHGEVLGRALAGCASRHLALDEPARAKQLERTLSRVGRVGGGQRLGLDDEDAGADAHVDLAFDFEADERLAHRGPRDAELAGELTLGGQALAGLEFARGDEPGELRGDLAVKTAAFDDLDRHGA